MQTRINSVNIEYVAKGKGYNVANVSYGDNKTKKIMDFANPAVFKAVQQFVGQDVEITETRDGQFTNWASISPIGAGQAASPSGAASSTKVTGSNYETREERASRQVLIVKQSSISAAVAALTPGAKAALDGQAVIDLAQKFTDFVFDNQAPE